MVTDICKGTFKGFALLRQLIQPQRGSALPGQQPFNLGPSMVQQRPVYAPGYGLIPPSQVRSPPTAALTPPSPAEARTRTGARQLSVGVSVPAVGRWRAQLACGGTAGAARGATRHRRVGARAHPLRPQLYGETAVGGTSTTLITSAAAGPSGLGGAASMGALSLGGRPVTLQLPPGYQYATLQPSGALQPLGGGVGDPSQQQVRRWGEWRLFNGGAAAGFVRGASVPSEAFLAHAASLLFFASFQVLVQGLGGTHHLTAAGQLVDSSGAGALLGSVQLPMQQVRSY